ncbi:MAG: DUF4976 domain-containing protein [Acidobacteria bacterium]|nr:DUF4976 domain-containing protein [Acidobacteriota bacterium]
MRPGIGIGGMMRWAGAAAILACLMAVWAAGRPDLRSTAGERPNILFVFADDHAAHAISSYGSRINRTPHIDRLAAEGMIFRNCFVTNSICAPSRAVILTGKHSHVNGVIDNSRSFDGSQQTFPKLLQRAGYQTAIIGKWHLKSDPTGFDHWEILVDQGTCFNPRFLTAAGPVDRTGYTTDLITDRVLECLKNQRDRDRPFMLMYQHKAPHREWQPDPRYRTLFEDTTIPEPPTLFDNWRHRSSAAARQTMTIARHLNPLDLKQVPPRYLNDEQLEAFRAHYEPLNRKVERGRLEGKDLVRWKYQRYIKDYLRCIASIDDNLGRLLDYLDRSGLARNTVVIYSSDQGFFLGDHGWFDKRFMYEESLRMPLMVRWPQVVAAGTQDTHLVQNLDFAQTFLDLAGVHAPDDMQGRSLLPLLRGESPSDWRRSAYYHYHEFPAWHDVRRHYGIRTDRYKLIHYCDLGEWELFDLKEDPAELRSRFADRAYAPVVDELRAELARLRRENGADSFSEPPVPPEPERVRLELVLHYDFEQADSGKVPDRSGKGHTGALQGGRIAEVGGNRMLELDGSGALALDPAPASMDPTYKPMTVGAWCRPESGNGVMVSHGTGNFGYSLLLQDGRPRFALRAGQQLFEVAGKQRLRLRQWAHVAATIDARGRITLYVGGRRVDRLDDGFFVSQWPRDVLSIGADLGARVGSYDSPMHFRGLIDDVRLYWGVVDEGTLRSWSRR